MISLLSTIKIVTHVTNAKQEQHVPPNPVLSTTSDNWTSLLPLSRRRALSTDSTTDICSHHDYTNSAFRLEILTDQNHPTEISWVLTDSKTNEVIHFAEDRDDAYEDTKPKSAFYQQSFFYESRGFCYQFQIFVKKNDGSSSTSSSSLHPSVASAPPAGPSSTSLNINSSSLTKTISSTLQQSNGEELSLSPTSVLPVSIPFF
jgi:hypothetical protein